MASEIEIKLDTQTIAGLSVTNGTIEHRVMCVHGWLDNANSFQPLLPLINNAELVAIDLPGHGHSDHQSSIYSIIEQAHVLLAVADKLGWDSFTLIGHSLGGCITPFATVAANNRINKLVLIEALGPRSETAEELPARIKRFHSDMSSPTKYQSRLYNSVEQAIESRLRANKMLPESARLIVERQLQSINDDNNTKKWQWRFDKKLRNTSPSYFTEAQVQSILNAIECPVLCILADDGYLTDRSETKDRIAKIKNHQTIYLPGHHHLHLDSPQPVADEINQFLN